MIARQNAWEPYYCINAMRATINQGLLQADRENTHDWSKIVAQQAMERTICTLSTLMGGCIRVKSTGLPVVYDDILYAIGGTFFVTATVAWAPHTGFYTPTITLIIYRYTSSGEVNPAYHCSSFDIARSYVRHHVK